MSESAQPHYEQRMGEDLSAIRAQVREVADRVETQVGDAMRALLGHDRRLADYIEGRYG
jgi:phosphate uptake regulator